MVSFCIYRINVLQLINLDMSYILMASLDDGITWLLYLAV